MQTAKLGYRKNTCGICTTPFMTYVDENEGNESQESSPNSLSSPTSRASFLKQGILGVVGMTGLSSVPPTASAGGGEKFLMEDISRRNLVGQTQYITWANLVPVILKMKADTKARFAKTGAKVGKEVAIYGMPDSSGMPVTVGIEVEDSSNSPAIGEGFTLQELAPPGPYMRRTSVKGAPSTLDWIGFVNQANSSGEKIRDPLIMFEVYDKPEDGGNVNYYLGVAPP
ncbi:unnamed protein product [Choristocarpus tenellus]